jgi:hypothetical protein
MAASVLVLLLPIFSWSQSPTSFGVNWDPAHIPNSSSDEIAQSVQEAAAVGKDMSFFWEWRQGSPLYSAAAVIIPAAQALGLGTLVQIQPVSLGVVTPPPDVTATSFGDAQLRSRYLADVASLAQLYPTYLNLAPEINFLYLLNPSEFAQFQTLYAQAYSSVKTISPATKVGVSYHLDLMFQFSQFGLINLLGPQDYVGFTTYPASLVYQGVFPSISQIPAEYYTRTRLLTQMPILFTEVGWPSAGRGSAQDQAAFVALLPQLMAGVHPDVVMWAKEHDDPHLSPSSLTPQELAVLAAFGVDPQQLCDELNSTGLRNWDGSAKPAWSAALSLVFQ